MKKSEIIRDLKAPLIMIALMWLLQLIRYLGHVELTFLGLYPRTLSGLQGILFAPFIHAGWFHLINNTLPFLITAFAIKSAYPTIARRVFVLIYLLTGIWVWVAARPAYHIGASGIVYGMISFLLMMGLLRREKKSIALALMVVFLYGSFIWGLFPIDPAISWESHMLGAVAGVFAAYRFRKVDWQRKVPEEPTPEELEKMPYWKFEVEGPLKDEYRQAPFKAAPSFPIRYIYKPAAEKKTKDEES